MAVFRVVKDRNFSIISNAPVFDSRLSFKAKGLLVMMLSLPDDWDHSIEYLAKQASDGRAAVTTGLKELEAAGYLTRQRVHDAHGRLAGTEYIIRETPIADNRTQAISDPPIADFPSTENPSTGNRTLLSTERLSTITPKAPKGVGVPQGTDPALDGFDEFWASWPAGKRKTGKPKAQRAWRRHVKDAQTRAAVMAALEAAKQSRDWIKDDGAYIPMPSTWLNGEYYHVDDVAPPPQPAPEERRALPHELVDLPDGSVLPYWQLPAGAAHQIVDHGLPRWVYG